MEEVADQLAQGAVAAGRHALQTVIRDLAHRAQRGVEDHAQARYQLLGAAGLFVEGEADQFRQLRG
ncbi:MAG: hypothetical protein E6I75_21910, partial [Chloroflexi bacterium]